MIYGRERTHSEWKNVLGGRSLPITFLDEEVFERNLLRMKARFESAKQISVHPALDLESLGSADLAWRGLQVWGHSSPDFVAHRWSSARGLLENSTARCLLRVPPSHPSDQDQWIDLLEKFSGRIFWAISSWDSLRDAKEWIERLKAKGLIVPILLELPDDAWRDRLSAGQSLGVGSGWSLKGFWKRKQRPPAVRSFVWLWNRLRSGTFRLQFDQSEGPDPSLLRATQTLKKMSHESSGEIPTDLWWVEESSVLLGSSEQVWVEGQSLEPALFSASSILETLENGAQVVLSVAHPNGTPWSPWGLEKVKPSSENASEIFLKLVRSHRGGLMEADALKGGDPVVFRISDLPEWTDVFPFARISVR